MSPEQSAGEAVDRTGRYDLYSLGVVGYQICSAAEPPFVARQHAGPPDEATLPSRRARSTIARLDVIGPRHAPRDVMTCWPRSRSHDSPAQRRSPRLRAGAGLRRGSATAGTARLTRVAEAGSGGPASVSEAGDTDRTRHGSASSVSGGRVRSRDARLAGFRTNPSQAHRR